MRVEYSSNNSGGGWWLDDKDWYALETAGWVVDWRPDRWLGALATSATREGLTLSQAIVEWEHVTNQVASDVGCECCGPPHHFSTV